MKEKMSREEAERQRKELEERLRRFEEDFERSKRGIDLEYDICTKRGIVTPNRNKFPFVTIPRCLSIVKS